MYTVGPTVRSGSRTGNQHVHIVFAAAERVERICAVDLAEGDLTARIVRAARAGHRNEAAIAGT